MKVCPKCGDQRVVKPCSSCGEVYGSALVIDRYARELSSERYLSVARAEKAEAALNAQQIRADTAEDERDRYRALVVEVKDAIDNGAHNAWFEEWSEHARRALESKDE